MTEEPRPKIFISHRFADKAIADVIMKHLSRWGFDDVFQASAPGSGPQAGEPLPDELKKALYEAKLVILVYTLADVDWSWCMWECGLATHPLNLDTRIVVFQCNKHSGPKPFVGHVMVRIDRDNIHRFTRQLHRDDDFFPGQPAIRPKITQQALEDFSNAFLRDLKAALPSNEPQERYRWDRFTLKLERASADALKQETDEETLLRNIQDELVVTDEPMVFGNALKHFGYADFETHLKLSDLVERWLQETKDRNIPQDWIIGLCREIWRAANNRPAVPEWQELNSVNFPELSLHPVLNHVRVLSDGSMEFDIYFYNAHHTKDATLATTSA